MGLGACTPATPLVSAPLYEGDAATLVANMPDAGRLPSPTTSGPKQIVTDPPEPVPPSWPHSENRICKDDLDPPGRAELPPPFEACPKRGPSGGQFSAKATREARSNSAGEPCCYVVYGGMAVPGRALRDAEDRAVVAGSAARSDWSADVRPRVDALTIAEREELARAWLATAALEHASIASFARFALDLMALGAPPHLVAGAHAAAEDEIVHARIAFAIASAYAGRELGPGALAFDGQRAPLDLTTFARETFVDGCIGETIAAIEAREASRGADDPSVRSAHRRIARDEERHAELAWRTLAWAVREGGDPVRETIRAALASARIPASLLAERAFASVIAPCATALVSA